jgi:hypothetical protein
MQFVIPPFAVGISASSADKVFLKSTSCTYWNTGSFGRFSFVLNRSINRKSLILVVKSSNNLFAETWLQKVSL